MSSTRTILGIEMDHRSAMFEVIKKIIQLSDEEKNNLSNEELENYSEYFVRELDFDISNKYLKEFNDALDLESTVESFITEENNFKKNIELINLCKQKIQENDPSINDYIILLEILNESNENSLDYYQYKEYFGYYIVYERFNEFLEVCSKLKVGPSALLKDNLEAGKLAIQKRLSQRKTIRNNMKKLLKADKLNNTNENSDEKKESIKYLVNLDELIETLSTGEILNMEALKLLIPKIGIYNYNYLIDTLFTLGALKNEDYLEHLNKYVVSQTKVM